jgi:hypothetical protein
MTSQILDFRTFPSSTTPPFEIFKSAPDLLAMYLGPQIESPENQTLVLHWASQEAYAAAATEDRSAYTSSVQVPVKHGNPSAALQAPCTEVMTAYGVEDAFLGQVVEFMAKVDGGVGKEDGYHGYAIGGETLGDIQKGPEGEKGKGVVLILGWDSKEAHVQAKGKPGRKCFATCLETLIWADILMQLSVTTYIWSGRRGRMLVW